MPRLLLVADTPWVRNEVLAALSEPGYDIDFVEDPRQVTERIAAELPDASAPPPSRWALRRRAG